MRAIETLIFLILCASTPLQAAEITGRVIDADTQMPVADARVRVLNADLAAKTDHRGHFLIRDLECRHPYASPSSHIAYLPGQRTVQRE